MTTGGFDAYLVDCRLGGRSGIDLLRAYRAVGRRRAGDHAVRRAGARGRPPRDGERRRGFSRQDAARRGSSRALRPLRRRELAARRGAPPRPRRAGVPGRRADGRARDDERSARGRGGRTAGGRARAARGRPPEGRLLRHARARAAQPARAARERDRDPVADRRRARGEGAVPAGPRRDRAAGPQHGAAHRRPSRPFPHDARKAGDAPRAGLPRGRRRKGPRDRRAAPRAPPAGVPSRSCPRSPSSSTPTRCASPRLSRTSSRTRPSSRSRAGASASRPCAAAETSSCRSWTPASGSARDTSGTSSRCSGRATALTIRSMEGWGSASRSRRASPSSTAAA